MNMNDQVAMSLLHRLINASRTVAPYRWRPYADQQDTPAQFGSETEALDWLSGRLPDVMIAQRWAWRHRQDRACWMYADAVAELFDRRNLWPYAAEIYQLGIRAAGRCGDTDAEAAVSTWFGRSLATQRRNSEAIEQYQHATGLYRTSGFTRGEATVAACWAQILLDQVPPDLVEAEHLLTRARDVFAQVPDRRGGLIAQRWFGELHAARGRFNDALASLLPLITAVLEPSGDGDRYLAAQVRKQAAHIALRSGNPRQALELLAPAEQELITAGGESALADLRALRARAHAAAGHRAPAVADWETAHRLYLSLGDLARAATVRMELIG